VDVLNALGKSLQVSRSDLWDGSGLWNNPRSTAEDEAAFWKRHNQS
jgi:hypothetical protein